MSDSARLRAPPRSRPLPDGAVRADRRGASRCSRSMPSISSWRAIREAVREPMMGRVRLQWWREAIEAIYAGRPYRHEVIAAARRRDRGARARPRAVRAADRCARARHGRRRRRPTCRRSSAMPREPRPARAAGARDVSRGGAERRGGPRRPRGRHRLVALAGLLRAVPFHARARRLYLPQALLDRHGVGRQDLLELRRPAGLPAVVRRCRAGSGAADRGGRAGGAGAAARDPAGAAAGQPRAALSYGGSRRAATTVSRPRAGGAARPRLAAVGAQLHRTVLTSHALREQLASRSRVEPARRDRRARGRRGRACARRGRARPPGRSGIGGNRPKLTFIGWKVSAVGAAGDMASSAPSAVVGGGGARCWPSALGRGEAAGEQPDRGALDIALDAGDLAGEAQARHRPSAAARRRAGAGC